MYFLIIILCLFLLAGESSGAEGYMADSSLSRIQLPLSIKTIKNLGKYALLLAQQKLAVNPKDAKGLLLLKLANHFIPNNRYVLLLRGRLKFKVKIKPPEIKVNSKAFLEKLNKAREQINESDTALNRHLLAVINQAVRLFKPEDEIAIVTLMQFSDKGIDINQSETWANY